MLGYVTQPRHRGAWRAVTESLSKGSIIVRELGEQTL